MKRLLCLMALLGLLIPQARAADDTAILQFAADALHADPSHVTVQAGDGPGVTVSIDGKVVGYAGSTWEIAHTAGYSGRPIDVLVFVDTTAVIRAARLVSQEEPVLTLGIKPEQLSSYIAAFTGYDLKRSVEPGKQHADAPSAIAGATISSGVIRSGIVRTARSLAEGRSSASGDTTVIDMSSKPPLSWEALVKEGSITHLHVAAGEADATIGVPGTAAPDATFIDLYAAVADAPAIGVSLIGETAYSELAGRMGGDDHALFVAASGLYSFKGTAWRKSGYFERLELQQGANTIQLMEPWHVPVEKVVASGAPNLREAAVFIVPGASGFDAVSPFRLSLIAERRDDADKNHSGRFGLNYTLPASHVIAHKAQSLAAEQPLWEQNWRGRMPAIGIVIAMLLSLYLILIFQNQIAARPPLYRKIRLGYLLATVIVLGALLSAQLSVVHALTFLQALRTQFNWENFLLDPVTFIIWGWVAVALLFWGRVYCGWLCPFGALQELLNRLAQRLRIKQTTVPFMLHERLWPIKYIAFLGLFAASLASMALAFRGAEIEPFKTAITFRFVREWPFVLYAAGLLVAGLFIERFYCRYLCPLGAALAIPARLRMFEWLKRRPQCGRECRICSTRCPMQAIHPEGHINPNECIYCLNCQTLYYDEHVCPPLKARAARRNAAFVTSTRDGGVTS